MQYSRNLFIKQNSETEFVLQLNDDKLAEELKQSLPSIFGRYIEEPKRIMNDGVEETHFKVSGMDLDSFNRHLTTFSPETLNDLSSK